MSQFRVMPCILACLSLGFLSFSTIATAEDANAYRTLAVIGSPSLQRSGLTDLVSHELQQAGAELVEREKLDAVIREKTLAAVLGPGGVGSRVDVGKLVKADALVLLTEEGDGKFRRLRVVVAECRQGARLSSASISLTDSTEAAAHEVADHVKATRARFAGGLKAMVGVPPFITGNFTYEHHRLQTGYAVLLQEALMKLPGVAVLEVEEAGEIRKELKATGGEVLGVLPLFVEGEFEVGYGPDKQPIVKLTIAARNTASSKTISRTDLKLEAASRFIARDLPGEILPEVNEGKKRPFTADAEFAELVERAEQFRKVGEWRHAADLHQAALVIRPGDADQRDKLVNDALKFDDSVFRMPIKPTGPEWEKLANEVFQCWEAAVESLEWQVHHDHIDVANFGRAADVISCVRNTSVADAAQKIRRDFLVNVYPLTWPAVRRLQAERADGFDLRPDWVNQAVIATIRPAGAFLVSEDYDVLLKFLNEIIPADIEPSHYLIGLLWGAGGKPMRATADYADFLRRLQQSDRKLNKILGRVATLSLQVERGEKLKAGALAEIEILRTDYLALKLVSCHQAMFPPVPDRLDQIKRALALPGLSNQQSLPADNAAAIDQRSAPRVLMNNEHLIELPDTAPAAIESGALRLERISLHIVKPADAQSLVADRWNRPPRGLEHFMHCTDGLDVLWDSTCVNFMSDPGTLKQIVFSPNDARAFGDVQWDGQQVWLAAYSGLRIVNRQGGSRMPSAQAEGLPPFDHAVRLHALGPGKVVIAGAFGPNHRAFLGLVETAGAAFTERVFLEAARIEETHNPDDPAHNVDLAFTPGQLVRCRTPGGGEYLVVMREGPTLAAMRHPLIVDLKTFKVWVSDTSIATTRVLGVDGKLLQCLEDREEYVLWRLSDDAHGFVSDLPHLRLPDDRGDPSSGPNNPTWAIGADGNVYFPGYKWFRIDPKTMLGTCLAEEGPAFAPSQHIAASGDGLLWWGMVGGKGTNMYRVRIDENKLLTPPKRDWQPPNPPIGNVPPASIFDLMAKPLAVGGRIGGSLVLTRPKEPPYTRKVVISVFHADRLLSRSTQRINLKTRDPNNSLLHYPWLARMEKAGENLDEPFVVHEAGDYRVEVTICSDDDSEKPLDHRTLNLGAEKRDAAKRGRS